MGEAKRRKSIDTNYGKTSYFKNKQDRDHKIYKIIDELHVEFNKELKFLARSKTTLAECSPILKRLSNWLIQKLSGYYRDEDKEDIANHLLEFFWVLFQENKVSPLILFSFIEVLYPHLPPKSREACVTYLNYLREQS